MLKRRTFLKALVAAGVAPAGFLEARELISKNSFAIPPLEKGRREGKDLYFELSLQKGLAQLLPSGNPKTKTYGINLPYLGTTLRAKKGDKVHIKVTNRLDETSTLHWHGMKLPADADGGPHQPIKPGDSWLSEFKIIQNASTLWYHSHQLHQTGRQVWQGLAGLFIIDDDESLKSGLPNEYGVDDIPVVIQDREFYQDGSFSYINSMHDKMMGKRGNVILVNGVMRPVLKTDKSLLRLRILNGSNARIYNLAFDDDREFYIIASDGGLLEKSIKAREFRLAPAERVEILVNLSDGKKPILMNKPSKAFANQRDMMSMVYGGIAKYDIFQIDASGSKKESVNIPTNLTLHKKIEPIENKRYFDMQMAMGPMMMFKDPFAINGKSMNMNRIDEVVKAGSKEMWIVKNSSMMPHPFHVHNAQFKIVDGTGHESGYKDTVLVGPNSEVKLLIEFPNYKDEKLPYMYHCHILEHEDQGMMGQFITV